MAARPRRKPSPLRRSDIPRRGEPLDSSRDFPYHEEYEERPPSESLSDPIARGRYSADWLVSPRPSVTPYRDQNFPPRDSYTPGVVISKPVVARQAKLYSLPRAATTAYKAFRHDAGRPPIRQMLGVTLRQPKRVYLCIKRYIKRRILFAYGVAGPNKRRSPGKGPRGQRYHRTPDSIYSCFRR